MHYEGNGAVFEEEQEEQAPQQQGITEACLRSGAARLSREDPESDGHRDQHRTDARGVECNELDEMTSKEVGKARN